MQNLEQIRAAAALQTAGNLDRSAVNKLPAMILTNGLLAAAAFCDAEGGGDNRSSMKAALTATAGHLAAQGHLPFGTKSIRAMIDELSKRDSQHLHRATAEALAYIAYLKRFAPKKP